LPLLAALALLGSAGLLPAPAMPPPPPQAQVETLVCFRHGEKLEPWHLGQLDARGLNRSLALPDVLLGKYGKPDFLFAPDPAALMEWKGEAHCYVRPLATIEPTAIRCGMPVDTRFGYRDVAGLEEELLRPRYRAATVFVCWEHARLEEFVRHLVARCGGDGGGVPAWDDAMGYDAIYLVRITTAGGKVSAAFSLDHEGLDGLPDTFPAPAKR
ncbi:MAG TPA: hypothetical protein VIM58_00210, partial [Candidatus Methylacidiphilales bacterium]